MRTALDYPVEVVSVEGVEGGFELRLEYLWEGRRREHRTVVSGPAMLKADGLAAVQVEVINVSAGGMQLFAASSVPEGSPAKICGADTERICFVRSCVAAPGGYLVGLQFYGEDSPGRAHGDK